MRVIISFICFFFVAFTGLAKGNDIYNLIIELSEASENSLIISYWENGFVRPLEVENNHQNNSCIYNIPSENLPCQLTIEFKPIDSNVRPRVLNVFMTNKDLHLAIPDWNNKPNWHGDMENLANEIFIGKCMAKKQQLQVLQNFLANYSEDDELSKQASITYSEKRDAYNQWVNQQRTENSNLWVSRVWKNQLIAGADISSDKEENVQEVIDHTFDLEDFTDTTLLNTDYYLNLINNYMSMNEMLVQLKGLNRESYMTEAGRKLVELASAGHPRLYGWVVDYLFTNYERYSLHGGIAMLKEQMNKPNCLTSKKQEINRRLAGIKSLIPGKKAQLLQLTNVLGESVNLFNHEDKLALLFFYESGCGHCSKSIGALKKWQAVTDVSSQLSIHTISLDDDFETWKEYHNQHAFEWADFHAPDGINGQAAKDYALLSTPSMIVLGKENVIEAVPKSIVELLGFIYGDDKVDIYLNLIEN